MNAKIFEPGPFAGLHLFFDLDGTISDPKRGLVNSVFHALDALGAPRPPADALDWMIGPPLHESMRRLVGEDRAMAALGLYRARYGETGLFENDLYPGMSEVLRALKAGGANLFVATAKLEEFARRIIDAFGLAPIFTRVYGSRPDGALAHKDALLKHLLDREGLTDGLMIGDRSSDCHGARANGLGAIGVLWGYGAPRELADCDARVAEPAELPAAIAEVAGKLKLLR